MSHNAGAMSPDSYHHFPHTYDLLATYIFKLCLASPNGLVHFIATAAPADCCPSAMQVVVEYDSAETDHFIELADAIEERFPGVAVDGVEKEDIPKGFFRIRAANGDILFVSEDSNIKPDPGAVVSILEEAGYSPEG